MLRRSTPKFTFRIRTQIMSIRPAMLRIENHMNQFFIYFFAPRAEWNRGFWQPIEVIKKNKFVFSFEVNNICR